MTDDQHLESLARDLHAIREEPDPEFARELDRRAADWLSERERRRRLPSLRIAVPALAAAAALVIALIVVGGESADTERLDVAVVPAKAAGGEALSAPAPERDSSAGAQDAHPEQAERAFLTSPPPARAGEPLVANYSIPEAARARVRLGGRETTVDVPAGDGNLEISTDGLDAGLYDLEIELPPIPPQPTRVEILPGD